MKRINTPVPDDWTVKKDKPKDWEKNGRMKATAKARELTLREKYE